LIYVHKFESSYIENMFPWEREILINRLNEYIKEENERIKAEERKLNAR